MGIEFGSRSRSLILSCLWPPLTSIPCAVGHTIQVPNRCHSSRGVNCHHWKRRTEMFGMNTYLLRCQVDANRTVQGGYDVDVFRTSQMKQVFSPVFTPVRSPPLNDVSPIVNHVPISVQSAHTYVGEGVGGGGSWQKSIGGFHDPLTSTLHHLSLDKARVFNQGPFLPVSLFSCSAGRVEVEVGFRLPHSEFSCLRHRVSCKCR